MTPPTAGPTLRDRLKPMLLSATAAGNCGRGTMSPTEACQEGLLRAVPQPSMKVKASNNQGDINPSKVVVIKAADTDSMNIWATSMARRRLKLSAIAPPSSENIMIGKEID